MNRENVCLNIFYCQFLALDNKRSEGFMEQWQWPTPSIILVWAMAVLNVYVYMCHQNVLHVRNDLWTEDKKK